MTPFESAAHRRLNALTREWVLVSPHRTQRPWLGEVERAARPAVLTYDPDCYLCPGNRRAHGDVNPNYASTFVFANDFPSLRMEANHEAMDLGGLIVAQPENGVCKVICFSPRHDLTLARMSVDEIEPVVRVWSEHFRALGAMENINSVQIFENHGAMMGASNPHPHCQIWASEGVPNELAKECISQSSYRHERGGCLLCDYLELEVKSAERLVCQNEHFVALVPFWAAWPFETLLLPRRHLGAIDELSDAEVRALADILHILTVRYDNLFEIDFPYSMGFHQRPTDGAEHPEWHFHAHYYPPLLRSATVRKFMVGFEMLGSPQRDFTAENAARRLRETSEVHYLERPV